MTDNTRDRIFNHKGGFFSILFDDDGHWYLCPTNKMGEAEKIMDEIREYWEDTKNYDKEEPKLPDYVIDMNKPISCLSFENPILL